ncbi:DUF937 domain-containing protein [Propionibacteriaceae bacterium G57]|uniref:DUF937 domain-containing protein n=1 Tax=Aestuariimicrobium sp. G57 TaxID=3418485 RepID=UPI003DA75EDB
MSLESEILSQIDTQQLAAQLGTDPATAEAGAAQAIRALVGGMHQNVQAGGGEASLAGALSDHAASNLFEGGQVNLDDVDTRDGEAIVGHVLGDNAEAGIAQFGGAQAAGIDQGMMGKLLKLLAPIVLAYIAQQITKKKGDVLDQAGGGQGEQGGGGILGQILGGILGGGILGGGQPEQPTQTQQQPQTQPQTGGGTFNTPGTGDGGLTMDPGAGSEQQRSTQQQPTQQQGGGIIGDILGGIFGGR